MSVLSDDETVTRVAREIHNITKREARSGASPLLLLAAHLVALEAYLKTSETLDRPREIIALEAIAAITLREIATTRLIDEAGEEKDAPQ